MKWLYQNTDEKWYHHGCYFNSGILLLKLFLDFQVFWNPNKQNVVRDGSLLGQVSTQGNWENRSDLISKIPPKSGCKNHHTCSC